MSFFVLVDDIIRQFAAPLEFELLQQVFLLALRDAFEIPVVDTGTLLEENLQVEAVAFDLGTDLHVGEEPLAPQARNGIGDEIAGQVDRVACDQSGRGFEDVGIEVLHTVDIDVADVVELLGGILPHHGGVFRECGLRRGRGVCRILFLGEYIRAA